MRDKYDALPLTKEQVYQEYEEAMLKLALFDMQEEETNRLQEEIQRQKGTDEGAALGQLVNENRSKTLRLIRRKVGRQQRKYFFANTLPKIGKAVAGILLMLFIGLTTAVATVQSVRVKVLEIIFNIEKEYTEISLREKKGASFDVPSDWQGEYYPAYIPKEFLVRQVVGDTGIKSILFQSAEGRRIHFTECTEDANGNIDTEDARIQFMLINGNPGLVAEKGNKTTISWSEFNKVFVLTCDATADIAMQIANSVIRIK